MFMHLSIRFLLLCLLTCQLAFSQQTESQPLNGEAIFLQRCAKCHGEKAEGVSAVITVAGPSLQAEHNPGEVMAAMEIDQATCLNSLTCFRFSRCGRWPIM